MGTGGSGVCPVWELILIYLSISRFLGCSILFPPNKPSPSRAARSDYGLCR